MGNDPYAYLKSELKQALNDKKCVVIVGTGVTMGATNRLPTSSWQGLLKSGAERCAALEPSLQTKWRLRQIDDIDSNDLDNMLGAATQITQKFGRDSGQYSRWLADTVGQFKVQPGHDDVLNALAELHAQKHCRIATTNYDSLLERALGADAINWRQHDQSLAFLNGDYSAIWHIHGHWRDAKSVILDIRDYEKIVNDATLQNALRSMVTTHSLLFVGCGAGLEDPNFGALLNWAGEALKASPRQHFRLCLEGELATLSTAHPKEQNIKLIPYGDKHSDLALFLQSLLIP